MQNYVMATQNKGKIKELKELLAGTDIDIISMADAGLADLDIDENGTTCEENSLIKARTVAALTGMPAIADDAGLFVDALSGDPGIHSARYAGVHGDDAANRKLLLSNLAGVPDDKRGAHFMCVISLVYPDPDKAITVPSDPDAVAKAYAELDKTSLADPTTKSNEHVFAGRCYGHIGYEEKGTNGFGYDSIFIPTEDNECGLTFAEISLEEKNKKSHRAKALALFKKYLSEQA
jgi:XTP/dITP diphosphohydrolase